MSTDNQILGDIVNEIKSMKTALLDLKKDLTINYKMLVDAVVAQDRVPAEVLNNIVKSYSRERWVWIIIVSSLVCFVVGIKFFSPRLLGVG